MLCIRVQYASYYVSVYTLVGDALLLSKQSPVSAIARLLLHISLIQNKSNEVGLLIYRIPTQLNSTSQQQSPSHLPSDIRNLTNLGKGNYQKLTRCHLANDIHIVPSPHTTYALLTIVCRKLSSLAAHQNISIRARRMNIQYS